MKRFLIFLLLFTLVFFSIPAAAAAAPFTLDAVWLLADPAAPGTRVTMTELDGRNYLFLPEGYDPKSVCFYFSCSQEATRCTLVGALDEVAITSGAPVDLTALCGQTDSYEVTLRAVRGAVTRRLSFTIVRTDGIASLFLLSEDAENQGREWVEASPDKSNKAKGSMLLLSPDGTTVYDGALTQIKGRGNTTWSLPKRPYQIKLKSKTDLLQTGNADNASKTWVLLANYLDDSLLRSQIVYDLSVAMGMEPGIECRPVNLFYDGEYRGSYLLCEKAEVNSGRVDIADLEEANEEANPGTELEDLPVATGKTANGATYTYCEGMTDPENITGGYLLEMEIPARALTEVCYFVTSREQYVVVKSPECASKAQMDYIASRYQEFEDTVFNRGVHPVSGRPLSDYAKIDSLAQTYLINELSKNTDAYASSTYLYLDADSTHFVSGPVWDYDLSFGHKWGDHIEAAAKPEDYYCLSIPFVSALFASAEFRRSVHDLYFDTMLPLLGDTLLAGGVQTDALCSLDVYTALLRTSARANALLWPAQEESWEENCAALCAYIRARTAWLTAAYSSWSAENDYLDVPADAWYSSAVISATQQGILNGMGDGRFCPEDFSTRAQSAKVLFAISGAQAPEFRPVFTDVFSHDWFCPAVLWAQGNGIVLGQGDGTFAPEENITREDFVVLLYRFLGSPDAGGDCLAAFPDSAKIDAYAVKAMQWAVNAGLLKGYAEDGTLRPLANITRAELATLIVRFHETFLQP